LHWEPRFVAGDEVEINVMSMTASCNERALSKGQFRLAADEDEDDWQKICEVWLPKGRTELRPLPITEAGKKLPVLLLSGELDPVTPNQNADHVKAEFTNAKSYMIKGFSHAVFFYSECVQEMVTSFFSDPDSIKENTCDRPIDFKPSKDLIQSIFTPVDVTSSVVTDQKGNKIDFQTDTSSYYWSKWLFWFKREQLQGAAGSITDHGSITLQGTPFFVFSGNLHPDETKVVNIAFWKSPSGSKSLVTHVSEGNIEAEFKATILPSIVRRLKSDHPELF
jgi:hypothetical protein